MTSKIKNPNERNKKTSGFRTLIINQQLKTTLIKDF